jgi:predicted PolB exonuclease-like 3'-5' exonuclease
MQHATLVVFDLETVYDTEAAARLVNCPADDAPRCRRELEEYFQKRRNSAQFVLPPPPFHRVIVMSLLKLRIEHENNGERYCLVKLDSLCHGECTEREMVERFFRGVETNQCRLVTFNGRRFDLPVLKYRAMLHQVPAAWFHHPNEDRWQNYQSRYGIDWHCDLYQVLTDYGCSDSVTLDQACAAFGLPGKMGVDGSKVADLYDAGRIEAIRNYCEFDVLNTYLLYLRYMLLRGRLSIKAHADAIEDLGRFFEDRGGERPHLREFHQLWRGPKSLAHAQA